MATPCFTTHVHTTHSGNWSTYGRVLSWTSYMVYSECTHKKKGMKNGNWMDEKLDADLLAINKGAPIKLMARIHEMPNMPL
jgi:hypothetical protein